MDASPIVILKPGKEKTFQNRHHWIFSGAIESAPAHLSGEILPVYSHKKVFLGSAYFNSKSSIIGRIISFDKTDPEIAIKNAIEEAIQLRHHLHFSPHTTAYRLINAEADHLPGLVVDYYSQHLVIQISTAGMEKLKPIILSHLQTLCHPHSIYEKSSSSSRRGEGLADVSTLHVGTLPEKVSIVENNLKFEVDIKTGQKTGWFLDHREMRRWVQNNAHQKRVLNGFGYTGGFTIAALAGGALSVDTVDTSQSALALAKTHVSLNNFSTDSCNFYMEDMFSFLEKNPLDNYQLVILDPPAFAKHKKDIHNATEAYRRLHELLFSKITPGTLVLTASCSYYMDEALFQTVIFQAARAQKRCVRIIGRHQLAPDHPICIFHPEMEYLKSLILFVGERF